MTQFLPLSLSLIVLDCSSVRSPLVHDLELRRPPLTRVVPRNDPSIPLPKIPASLQVGARSEEERIDLDRVR